MAQQLKDERRAVTDALRNLQHVRLKTATRRFSFDARAVANPALETGRR